MRSSVLVCSSRCLDVVGRLRTLTATSSSWTYWPRYREFQQALNQIGKKYVLDKFGECVAMWQLLFMACPQLVLRFFGRLAARRVDAAAQVFFARGVGKRSADTQPGDVRVVIPLSARAQILDALMAARLTTVADSMPTPGWFVAAVKFIQPMDIAFTATQIIEHSLDDHSRGAVTAMDIASYYGNLDPLLVCQWLLQRAHVACPPSLVRAVLIW